MRVALSAVTAVLAISGSLAAQTYTVKLDGTGDFTDLQVALDTVPSGATLLVSPRGDGGIDYGSVTVSQSVTVIGESDPTWGPPTIGGYAGSWWGPFEAKPGIYVSTPSDATVVLENLNITMREDDVLPTLGIVVDSVGKIIIDRCTVQAASAELEDPMPNGRTSPTAVMVEGTASVVAILNSTLLGAKGTDESNIGDWGGCAGNGTVIGGPGGHALDATNAGMALVSDSTLVGADGGQARWGIDYGCGDSAPDVLQGGDGGDAIAGNAYVSNCILTPGKGGGFSIDPKWGVGSNGSDGVEVSGTRIDLPNNIAVSGPATIGASLTFSGSGFSPFHVAFIFESLEISAPFHIRQGAWFLAPSIFLLGAATTDVSGAFSLTGSVPNDSSLVGLSLALQFADTDHLSEPVLLVVGE